MPEHTPTPAEDFYVTRSWVTKEHAAYLQDRMSEQGIPYCRECHDWHHPHEEHSMSEEELGN